MKATIAAAVFTSTSAIKIERQSPMTSSYGQPQLTRVTDPYELGSLGYYPDVNIND